MIGVIERIKNSVLMKCSTLNDDVIEADLSKIIDTCIYHFVESVMSTLVGININLTEEKLRTDITNIIKVPIMKKLKRKLFIDSLALQITNDSFIESYVKKEITINEIEKDYLKELDINKSSNQLNMTEDINMNEIIEPVRIYVDTNINNKVSENIFLVNGINGLLNKMNDDLESSLDKMIKDTDLKYLEILKNEIAINEEEKVEKGNEIMMDEKEFVPEVTVDANKTNKFSKYDDMTLFNKTILSLNTKEEKLARSESKLEKKQKEIDDVLATTNKNIEANIERENKLSQRRLELNSKEVELNSKLSEAEVIFLNMKPLINGLNKIKVSDDNGGSSNE